MDESVRGSRKRIFRAKRKLNVAGLISHITQRAAGKEPLFLEDSDYLYMLVLLKEISEQHSIRIYAFCFMPNHVHLLLSPEEQDLYDAMRNLFSRYAMWFNKKYERKGHLFGGPYRQAVCLDDGYLIAASAYIHLNPLKAGLVKSADDYRWSSVRLYCSANVPESFVTPDFVLSILSNNNETGRIRYRALLKFGETVKTENVFEQEDVIEYFRDRLSVLFPSLFKKMAQKNRAAQEFGIELLSKEALDERIENLKNTAFKNKPESRLAKKYLIEQLISRGYNRENIAQRLGISRKTVFNILRVGK